MKHKAAAKKMLLKTLILLVMSVCLTASHSFAQKGSYKDNADGTITDNKTKLMWQKAGDGTPRTLPQARTYCDTLSLADHQDWRLPRIDELETIVDYSLFDPALDPIFIHAAPSGFYGYWPDTQTQYSTEYFWYVSFLDGYVGYTYDYNPAGLVRCVRGGPYWTLDTSTRLIQYKGEAIIDTLNFRMWQKIIDGGYRTWIEANQYCGELTVGGFSDWRIPTIKEAESIIDYTKQMPALSSIFDLAVDQIGNYWTATPYIHDPPGMWYANYGYGVTSYEDNDNLDELFIRCVRDMKVYLPMVIKSMYAN